ncbi:MAG: SPOR domain-containing protein [Candidatus Binatia bacterium]
MAHDQKGNGKQFYFYRRQLVVLALAFAMTALITLFFGVITGKTVARRSIPERAAPVVKIPIDSLPAVLDSAPDAQPDKNAAFENASTKLAAAEHPDQDPPSEPKPQGKTAKAEITKLTLPVNGPTETVPGAADAKSGEKAAFPPAAREERRSLPAKGESPDHVWTVQVKSSPEKTYVERWVDRLKSKGYDAFITAADIKGQTWYRLRVGHFGTRQEAETLRNALETKEGFRGTFLLQTTK